MPNCGITTYKITFAELNGRNCYNYYIRLSKMGLD